MLPGIYQVAELTPSFRFACVPDDPIRSDPILMPIPFDLGVMNLQRWTWLG